MALAHFRCTHEQQKERISIDFWLPSIAIFWVSIGKIYWRFCLVSGSFISPSRIDFEIYLFIYPLIFFKFKKSKIPKKISKNHKKLWYLNQKWVPLLLNQISLSSSLTIHNPSFQTHLIANQFLITYSKFRVELINTENHLQSSKITRSMTNRLSKHFFKFMLDWFWVFSSLISGFCWRFT